ncbi:MAG: UDP-N-acetylglucosamine--N-acetylmuramyl-(pentapeptide) pyrophosphoryl-undecaprenol N-acetylglucosamine transferase, partial [Eggerthellaceae bacterium]|nr:UDP-N-acetylglucosamine--N-acetylmuramyl-(pentapeptide) pyrophosphoryl-undecaprenol N-acetylglucosamine transferase [Eggerthellaceae bacterium]
NDRGVEVFLAGTPTGVEARLVPAAGIPFEAFEASGFDRAHPMSLVKGVRKISASTGKAKEWFSKIAPDVVVGFGGYVSIPVARAAESLGIPVVLHEQNSVMGMANKYLAKKAHDICLTYGCAAPEKSDPSKVHVTGNPVRKSVMASTRREGREMLGIDDDKTLLLVFGGSLGARHINQAMVKLKDELLAIPDLAIVHITGPKEYDSVVGALNLDDEQSKKWIVMGYQDRMGETLAATDIIISRAGATSLAEISAREIPALLVPYPYATDDHQTTNAKTLLEAQAAEMISDDLVETEEFREKVLELIGDEDLRARMKAHAHEMDAQNAAAKLADVVMAARQPAPRIP